MLRDCDFSSAGSRPWLLQVIDTIRVIRDAMIVFGGTCQWGVVWVCVCGEGFCHFQPTVTQKLTEKLSCIPGVWGSTKKSAEQKLSLACCFRALEWMLSLVVSCTSRVW